MLIMISDAIWRIYAAISSIDSSPGTNNIVSRDWNYDRIMCMTRCGYLLECDGMCTPFMYDVFLVVGVILHLR